MRSLHDDQHFAVNQFVDLIVGTPEMAHYGDIDLVLFEQDRIVGCGQSLARLRDKCCPGIFSYLAFDDVRICDDVVRRVPHPHYAQLVRWPPKLM